MATASKKIATDETLNLLGKDTSLLLIKEAIQALPNATQAAADNANAAATAATNAIASLGALVASTYDATSTYKAGDYAYYDNKLYRCIVAITTAEAFTSAHWVQVKLGNDVEDLETLIKGIAPAIPHAVALNSLDKWTGNVPQVSLMYVPITVLKKTTILGLKFVTQFSVAGTVNVSIRKFNGTDIIRQNDVVIDSTGENTIEVYLPCVLEPAEYRIYVKSDSAAFNYPSLSTRQPISNEFFTTTGTQYMYNNSDVSYYGEVYFVESWENALLDAYERFVNEGLIQYKLDNVVAENPDILIPGSYSSNGPTKADNGDITIDQASGNVWFTYKADKTKLIGNYVIIDFDIEITRGAGMVWFLGTKTNGDTLYGDQGTVSENGHVTKVVDLSYYVIYQSLDMTKDIKFGVGNSGNTLAVVKNFKLSTPMYDFNTNQPFYQTVNEIYNKTQENANAITAMSGDSFFTSPNGSKFVLAVANDGSVHSISIVPGHTLFVGNSLLLGNGGGANAFGMCASDPTKDYYYKVSQKILELNQNATFEKLGGYDFENATSVASANTWMAGTLLPKLGSGVDLVIVQLGDNVNTSGKLSTFEQTCAMLIQYIKENAPNARVAWAGEWYASAAKQAVIANACAAKGATFIDLTSVHTPGTNSYIGAVINYGVSSSRNYTIDSYTDDSANHQLTVIFTVNGTQYQSVVPYSSYSVDGSTLTVTGNYGIVTDAGVASHPGDAGMSAIGDLMISRLGLE